MEETIFSDFEINGGLGVSPPSPLTHHELLQILELLGTPEFSEFRLHSGDLEVEARRSREPSAYAAHPPVRPATSAALSPSIATAAVPPDASPRKAGTPGTAAPPQPARNPHAVLVTAPMVGTFYAAPEPGAAPFVQLGQRIERSTTPRRLRRAGDREPGERWTAGRTRPVADGDRAVAARRP